jgi:hypothetical protein
MNPKSPSPRPLIRVLAAALTALIPLKQADASAETPNPGLSYYYPAPEAPVVDVEADVVIYGATSGGVVAAAQATRMGKSVALIAFGRHLGGMTSGGLTETDAVDAQVQGGITREYFDAVGRDSGFKPSTAELAFEAIVADPIPDASWDAPVPTYYEQRLASVEKDGARIVALHMENGSIFRGKMFIDCTYEGDLMAQAGVSYTYGREPSSQYGESKAGKIGPVGLSHSTDAYVIEGDAESGLIYNVTDEAAGSNGSGDEHLQAYNFRMYTVQKSDPTEKQPLFEPATYDPTQFEMLYRYHRADGYTRMTVGNDINNHEMFDRGVSTDHIGGNRWPDGNGGWIAWPEADYATRELIYQSHVSWQLGMLWYLKNDARYRALATDSSLSYKIQGKIQDLLNKVDELGFPLGEYPETGGWPHELYVREARRMLSDLVITQDHFDRKIIEEDSVGLANYTADSHHVRRIVGSNGAVRVEGDTGGSGSSTWRIPYRALIPKQSECENLLVPWALSASHVAFCSTRMEPCLMVLSQSAATAAALSIDRDEAVQELPYPLLKLQLLADGQILGEAPVETVAGEIVDNADASGFTSTGTWLASSSTAGYYGSDYLHNNNIASGNTATFTPTLPQSGYYKVYTRWTAHTNRATNASYTITHKNGSTQVLTDQTINGDLWNSLGTFEFDSGSTGHVTVSDTDTDGYVIVDAVRFVEIDEDDLDQQTVNVLASDPRADESIGSPGIFKFVRDNDDITQALTIHFTVSGSALPGSEYTALPSSVTIPAYKRSIELKVTPISDSIAQGTRTIIVTVTQDAGYTIGTQSSATITLHDKPYDAWRATTYTAPNASETEQNQDSDADGISNRLEFFLGTDPLQPTNRQANQQVEFTDENELKLTFTRAGYAKEEAYEIQFSETLLAGSWSTLNNTPDTLSYDPESGDRILQTSIDTSKQDKGFLRINLLTE